MGTQPTNETDPNDINPSDDGIPAPSGDANLIDTDYVVGQDNFAGKLVIPLDIHSKVFLISGITILLFVLLTLSLQDEAATVFTGVRNWLTSNMSGFFLFAGNVFVVLCVALIFSPLGKVRLGGRDAVPDFTYTGWFSMLFAAGMGIGLMFYGVAEPMSHFSAALDGVTVDADGVRTDWSPLG